MDPGALGVELFQVGSVFLRWPGGSGTGGSLLGLEIGGLSFLHLAKCCLMATSHKIGSVLQDREVDSKQPVTVPHKTLQL